MFFKKAADKEDWQISATMSESVQRFLIKSSLNPRFFLYRYKWNRYGQSRQVNAFPLEVMVETANCCNLRCEMCFQSKTNISQVSGQELMDFSTFKKIIDECVREGVYSVKLSWRGEPLMNPEFIKMVKYAKSKKILEVATLTNGMLLDKETSRQLVDLGMDIVIISIDGFTKETYEKIRRGAVYETVVQNVEQLLKFKKERNASKPFVRIQYTQSENNLSETEAFLAFWKDKVNEVSISYYQDFDSVVAGKEQPRFAGKTKRVSCVYPWLRLVIVPDGRVTICACDVMLKQVVGNINKNTIKEIWHSKEMGRIRKLHTDGRLDLLPTCKVCNAASTYR